MRLGKAKFSKRRNFFSLLILFSFVISILPAGMRNVRAEELNGEEILTKIELSAEVIWSGVPDGEAVPEATINLMYGKNIVESIVIKDGSTLVKFAPVDELDADGNVILYTIDQEPLENYKTEIREFIIANTYIPPVVKEPAVEEPIIEEPVVEEPIVEEPVVEEPIVEEPVVEEPIVEEPIVEEPVVEEPIVEEPIVEDPVVEEPIVEEPIVEEPVVEEPVVEEPAAEEPKAELPLVEESVADAPPPVEEAQAEEAKLVEETATVENQLLAAPDFQVMATSYTYSANSYFDAVGDSTNNHFIVVGVFIGTDGNVYLILDNDKNTAAQFRFYNPTLNGVNAAGYGLPAEPTNQSTDSYQDYWVGNTLPPYTTNVYLNYPDNTTQTISGKRLFIFNLGPMTGNLMANNTLSMNNAAGGFRIEGMTFDLILKYTIDKVVVPSTATIGQEVLYTITVKNDGNFQISDLDVLDTVPHGITILSVSKDGGTTWENPVYNSGVLVLDTNIKIAAGASIVYKVKAYVNTDAKDGEVLTNRAYTAGSVVSQEDFASVTVRAVDVTVTKNITGNMSNPLDTFAFTIEVTNGSTSIHYEGENDTFNLGDDGTYTMLDLPKDGVVTISEVSMGYEVTVTVGGEVQVPDDNGVYTITLNGNDITIDVVNHKEVIIPTGIQLDSMPYILIFILLGAASFSGYYSKRKHLNFN